MSGKTNIYLLIDRSGSMDRHQRQAEKAVASWVNSIRESSLANAHPTVVSVCMFDHVLEWPYVFTPVDRIGHISIYPRGNTALLDALGEAMELVTEAMAQNPDDSYLIVAMTDGEENASNKHKFTAKGRAVGLLASGRVDVALLVPPGYRDAAARMVGLSKDNVKEWEATAEGFQRMEAQMTTSFTSYTTSRASGQRSVGTFFVNPDDISKVALNQMSNLDAAKVTQLAVSNRDPVVIQDFAVKNTGTYEMGRWYYELTKSEALYPSKDIVIHDVATGKWYQGPAARDLLGLPKTDKCRVRPGKDRQRVLYLQSTSVNRKLVPGSTVIRIAK